MTLNFGSCFCLSGILQILPLHQVYVVLGIKCGFVHTRQALRQGSCSPSPVWNILSLPLVALEDLPVSMSRGSPLIQVTHILDQDQPPQGASFWHRGPLCALSRYLGCLPGRVMMSLLALFPEVPRVALEDLPCFKTFLSLSTPRWGNRERALPTSVHRCSLCYPPPSFLSDTGNHQLLGQVLLNGK